jgi:hypothetical protein
MPIAAEIILNPPMTAVLAASHMSAQFGGPTLDGYL